MAIPRSTFWWLSLILTSRRVVRLGSLTIGLTLCSTAFGAVQLLLERDTDIAGQTDLFLVGYADQNAFLDNTGLVISSLPLPISADFSAAGLHFTIDAQPPNPAPEPGTFALLGLGLAGLALMRRRRRASSHDRQLADGGKASVGQIAAGSKGSTATMRTSTRFPQSHAQWCRDTA